MPAGTGPAWTRRATVAVVLVAVLAGVIAATGPASPTGHGPTDAVLTGLGIGLVVAVGSRAPWWAIGAAAGIALAVAIDPLLMAVAAVGLAAALWTGTSREPSPELLAISLGVTTNVLVRAELGGPFAASAVIGVGVGVALFLLGSWALPTGLRRAVWGGTVVVVLLGGAAAAGFGYAAATSRHELARGMSLAELGVSSLEHGEFEEATEYFELAHGYLDEANTNLDRPWAELAAFVPVVGHYQRAVSDMSHAGADGLQVVSDALDEVDLDALRPSGGRFDLAQLAAVEEPLTRVRDALVELREASEASRSEWLVNRATKELDNFSESVDDHLPAIEHALRALRLAPDMLGRDEPRTYLLLFTTPSEARGLGGFVGSYAELHVDDGQLTFGAFGRSQDLDRAALRAGARISGHEEFLAFYERFGFNGDGAGSVGDAAFRNVAMTPDYPTMAEIAAELYPQVAGRTVDGVITMDPFVLRQIVKYTGPVTIPSLDEELDRDEVLPYLLREQYKTDEPDDERADALAEAAQAAFDELIDGDLPDPITLAQDLAPLTGERRLLVWSARPEEQEMIEEVGIGGAMPALDGADGWAFTVSNAGGGKIDTYLDRRAEYDSETDDDTGITSGTVRIELDNGAPAEGGARYIVRSLIGQPDGTSSLWVTVYSPLGLDGLTVDGEPVGVEAGVEQGWNAYRFRVDIPPSSSVQIEASLSGMVADPDADVVTWEQPMERDVESL
jgi:tetratricopeptide (TPR) repeat protein